MLCRTLTIPITERTKVAKLMMCATLHRCNIETARNQVRTSMLKTTKPCLIWNFKKWSFFESVKSGTNTSGPT